MDCYISESILRHWYPRHCRYSEQFRWCIVEPARYLQNSHSGGRIQGTCCWILCSSSIGCFSNWSQHTGNALSGGFDLAATFPRFINIRRGAYLTALFSMAVNPQRLVNTATTFISVLGSYSVFLGPMTGLMISSYFVMHKRKINVDDLFVGNKSIIYWYTWVSIGELLLP